MLNKRKNSRIIAYIIAAVVFVVLIFSIIIPEGSMNTYATEDTPTFSITEVSSGANNKRRVEISVANAVAGVTYTVYYRTQNGSAIAGEHFNAVSGSVTITKGVTQTVDITLKDKKTMDDYGVGITTTSNNKSTTSNGYTYSYTSNNETKSVAISSTKTFMCEIYYAECSSGTTADGTLAISSTKGSVELSYYAPSNFLELTKVNNTYYLEQTQWTKTSNQFKWATIVDDDYYEGFSGFPESGTVQFIEYDTMGTMKDTHHYSTDGTKLTSTSSAKSGSSNVVIGVCKVPTDNYEYFSTQLGLKKYFGIDISTSYSSIWGGSAYFRLYYLSKLNALNST